MKKQATISNFPNCYAIHQVKQKHPIVVIGRANFILYEDKPLITEYAKKKVKKNPELKYCFQVLEREAATPVTSAVHGWCRQNLIDNKDFKKIKKELNK